MTTTPSPERLTLAQQRVLYADPPPLVPLNGGANGNGKGSQKRTSAAGEPLPQTNTGKPTGIEAILGAIGKGWVQTKDGQTRRSTLERGDLSQLLTDVLQGRIGFDELALMPAVDDTTLRAAEVDLLHVHLSEYGWRIAKCDATDGLLLAAHRNRFHPVRRYLERLEADTSITPIDLSSFGADYYGTAEPLHGRFMRILLMGAVWRAMEPGCDFKTCVVLQSGRQTVFKSRSLKALAGPEWFCDTSQENEKDLLLAIHTCWIYELAEIETQTGKKAAGKLKNQLSSTVDQFRVPYGRGMEKMPRASIFAGSCNRDDFLVDETGNTRFLIVPIPKKIDYQRIERDRDRIWKAAVAAYRSGEHPWLTDLELEASERQNQRFTAEHEWTDPVARWLEKNPGQAAEGFTSVDALLGSGVRKDIDSIQPNRDASQMGKVLRAMGYERTDNPLRLPGGGRARLWKQAGTGGTGGTGGKTGTCASPNPSADKGSDTPGTGGTPFFQDQSVSAEGHCRRHIVLSGNSAVPPVLDPKNPCAAVDLPRHRSRHTTPVPPVPPPSFLPGDDDPAWGPPPASLSG